MNKPMTIDQYLVKRLVSLEEENNSITADNEWRKHRVEALERVNDALHKDLAFLASLIELKDGSGDTKYYQTDMIFEPYKAETFKRITDIKGSIEDYLPF